MINFYEFVFKFVPHKAYSSQISIKYKKGGGHIVSIQTASLLLSNIPQNHKNFTRICGSFYFPRKLLVKVGAAHKFLFAF